MNHQITADPPSRFYSQQEDICDTWTRMRTGLPRETKRGLHSLFILITWCIWNERNTRVFSEETKTVNQLIDHIKSEAKLWILAGARNLGRLMSQE